MIVRIATEGQYRISSSVLDMLNELDNQMVHRVAEGDEESFRALLLQMLESVRSQGVLIPDEEITTSDVILPAPDTTLEEAKSLFTAEGVIPG